MSTTPLFTAIIHTYNRPALLKESVQALLRQTYTNLEVILINNGSTPETIEYLQKVSSEDARIRLINFSENQFSWDDVCLYIDVCWNAALQSATGDYIWIQEDDDLIADDYVEKMVALFQENPECTTAAGLMVGIDESGNPTTSDLRTTNFRSRFMPGHLLALDHLRGGKLIFAAPGTVFTFRREQLIDAGGFHKSIMVSQLYGIVPFGITGFDETAICYWRYHPDALNRRVADRGNIGGLKYDFSIAEEWDIAGRWQIFGKELANEVVSTINRQAGSSVAERFVIQMYSFRLTSCIRIIFSMWKHRHFWFSIPKHAKERHPLRRWLRPIAKPIFSNFSGLAKIFISR